MMDGHVAECRYLTFDGLMKEDTHLLRVRVVCEGLEYLDAVNLELLDLESEFSFFSSFNNGSVHILLERIDVLCYPVGVLLDVAVSLQPKVVRLAEDDQILWGVADLIVRLVLGLVLNFLSKREKEGLLILFVSSQGGPRGRGVPSEDSSALTLDHGYCGAFIVAELMESGSFVSVSRASVEQCQFWDLMHEIHPLHQKFLFW